MTSSPSPRSTRSRQQFAASRRSVDDTYIHQFWHATKRVLLSSYRHSISLADAEDIASAAVIKVLPRLEDYRARYESPEVLARVMASQRKVDFDRSERVQRGEGAHLITVSEPSDPIAPSEFSHGTASAPPRRVPARSVCSLEALTGFDPPSQDNIDALVNRCHAEELTHSLIESLRTIHQISPRDLRLFIKVDGYGLSVKQAAAELGLRRETAQRALGRVRKLAREVLYLTTSPTRCQDR